MKKILTTTAFLILHAICAQQITSTFDSGIDGWIVTGDATSADPNYSATGGNPDGFAAADDTAAGGVWFWSAPAKFLGDQSESFGKTLRFDLKQSSLNSQFDDSDIIITGLDSTISLDLSNNPGIDWTHYSVALDETFPWKFGFITNSNLATTEEIRAVLSNITSLKIRGEYVSGSDTGGLDNVVLQTTRLAADSFVSSKLYFYPNPTTHTIYLPETVSEISIHNLNGAKMTVSFNNHIADISALFDGVYILEMISDGKSEFQKMIKK